MTAHQALASAEARAENEPIVKTPEQRAAGMVDHWNAFNAREEHRFFTYFMLDTHAEERQLFLAAIDASTELPYPNDTPQAVVKTGRAILWASTQGYENGDPFAVSYTGERVYPVE